MIRLYNASNSMYTSTVHGSDIAKPGMLRNRTEWNGTEQNRKLSVIAIVYHLYSDALARKLYNCGSGYDLPSMVCIHLTVHCKFGVALLFGSGVII